MGVSEKVEKGKTIWKIKSCFKSKDVEYKRKKDRREETIFKSGENEIEKKNEKGKKKNEKGKK